ncbi:hypothetical protein PIB30_102193 [Stylosanthes scabra]|uniref:Putative plant transposon protein domain-containing protein n=1 Tax=Stylosanthes scabra TaxID=79078 RepID=A0ABU6ZWH2_9FABA|nr:hypothetical protein [Stylosanthes scabra]
MAALLRKKKGKAQATSSSEAPLFKTLYHEAHYKRFFIVREVLPEARIEVDDDSLAPMAIQIKTRKWQKVTRPNLNVGYSLVREFYANAWRTDADKKSPPPYTTQVRGAEISFAPDDIQRVFKLRETPLPNTPSYHDKKANNDLRLEEVLACLYEERAQWVLHADGRPHFLRRADLQPMARGWYEFVCRSIIPTTNRSEVTVEWAVLIHSIIIGKDIQQPQFPPEFMENFNSTMATMQQHYDKKCDAFQQRFDEAQAENRKSFGEINTRMNQMDDQLSYLCYTHQIANESMFFPYQNTMR